LLEEHKDSVNVLDAAYFDQDFTFGVDSTQPGCLLTLIASASVDSTVKMWRRLSDYSLNEPRVGGGGGDGSLVAKFGVMQTFNSKQNGFSLALKLYSLPISKCRCLSQLLTVFY
jgi:hypothetical protein